MRRSFFYLLFLFPVGSYAQVDSSKWLRAFPITEYMVDLNDSVKVVQLEMPDGLSIKDKQLGLIWGVYHTSKEDVVSKGYGKCHLIKGNYYYFTIGNNKSGQSLKKGDLLYTLMDKTGIYYGQLPQLSGHFIRLQDVHGEPFYDRYTIFGSWTESLEKSMIDSMVNDIRFTGKYFLENDPSMNKQIEAGDFKGRYLLEIMQECKPAYLLDFFGYILARPRLYAGKEWKLSEIFATWLTNNAPKILKE
jgi:hypothetical protein